MEMDSLGLPFLSPPVLILFCITVCLSVCLLLDPKSPPPKVTRQQFVSLELLTSGHQIWYGDEQK